MYKSGSIILMVIALSLIIGCGSSSSEKVATVGGRDITLDRVRDYDKMFMTVFETPEEEFEAKKAFVDSLVDIELLIMGAYRNDLDIDQEVLQVVDQEKPRFLLDELFKKKILPQISVSESEVEAAYNKMKSEYHIKHIMVEEKELADSLYEVVTNGTDFEQIAREFSIDRQSAMNGGDLGYITWGGYSDDFQDEVFQLTRGQISRPFETGSGWHIVKLIDKRDTDPRPLEEEEFRIRNIIQQKKNQVVMSEYLETLYERSEIELNEKTYTSVRDFIDRVYPDTLGGKYFKKVMIDLALLEDYQKSEILATFPGGEITVQGYFEAIQQIPAPNRPDFKDKEGVRRVIFNINLNYFLTRAAQAEKLEESSEYKDVIESFKETVMADKMRILIVQGIPEPTEDEIYDYYSTNADEFATQRKIKVREIMSKDPELAESLRTVIDDGGDFKELASRHTSRPAYKPKGGDLGYFAPNEHPVIYRHAQDMNIGDIKGPIQIADNAWSIIMLEDTKTPEVPPIEDIALQVARKVKYDKQISALENWLDQRRAETEITTDYDLIWETIDKDSYASE